MFAAADRYADKVPVAAGGYEFNTAGTTPSTVIASPLLANTAAPCRRVSATLAHACFWARPPVRSSDGPNDFGISLV
jgi:hypothetical protein